MIKYGLKLWSSDKKNFFEETVFLHENKLIDFVELSHIAEKEIDFDKIGLLKKIPVEIHSPNDCGFHDFNFSEKHLAIWEKTIEMADFFDSSFLIVHPGKAKNFKNFQDNLKKIDDQRILIENMAGLDIYGDLTFGYKFDDLKKIKENKEICFDFEKAIKSACYQEIDYKEFIVDCLKELKPNYFHISGGDFKSVKDEHLNLQEANFDLKWIKDKLNKLSQEKDIFLVFEVPKNESDLMNDVENMKFYKKLAC